MWAEIANVGVDPLSKKLEKGCKLRTWLSAFGSGYSSIHDGQSVESTGERALTHGGFDGGVVKCRRRNVLAS
jgi:hypothetical protein